MVILIKEEIESEFIQGQPACFSKKEVELLAETIYSKLNIYTGVLHDRNDQWILTIGARYLELLRKTISLHFHNSMLYRIGL